MVRLRHLVAGSVVVCASAVLLAVGTCTVLSHFLKDVVWLNELPVSPPISPPKFSNISLLFVGDVMLERTVGTRIRSAQDDAYPFRAVMADPRFTDADVHILNLEGPLTASRRPPEKEIDFAFDQRFAEMLAGVGFDAVSQANNHALDQGRVGAEDSRRALNGAGLVVFGDEVKDDGLALAVMDVRGRKIALVGFNSASDVVGEVTASSTLAHARSAAETVIVYMHWGEEYRDYPTVQQETQAKWMVDHGADIVVGAHPHWVQGISLYKGKPILYSLGNFVFDQDWSEETKQGLVVRMSLSEREIVIEPHPVYISKSQPKFLDGDERAVRLQHLSRISDSSLAEQILSGRVVLPATDYPLPTTDF